jgi:hypothetical protein
MSSSDDKRPRGFYIKYLERLADRRAARGEPPAEDVAPQSYWDAWRKNNDMPLEKAA